MSNELLVKAQAIQRELDCDFTRAFQIATREKWRLAEARGTRLPLVFIEKVIW